MHESLNNFLLVFLAWVFGVLSGGGVILAVWTAWGSSKVSHLPEHRANSTLIVGLLSTLIWVSLSIAVLFSVGNSL